MECGSYLFIMKSNKTEPKQKSVTPSCHLFTWNHDVYMCREKVVVYLIILCGVKNLVGIVQIVSIFCTCGYNFLLF